MSRTSPEGPASWPGSLAGFPGLSWKHLLFRLWGCRGYLLFILDLLIFFSSIILAYYLRYFVDDIVRFIPPQDPSPPPITPFLKAATVLTIPWLFILARNGEYRNTPGLLTSTSWPIRDLINSGFLAFALLMVLGVLYHDLLVSRVVYFLAFCLALLTASGARLLVQCVGNYLSGQGILKGTLVVIRGGRRAAEFLHHLKSHNASVMVAGSLEPNGPAPADQVDLELPILGGLREIAAVFQRTPFDGLLFIPDEGEASSGFLDRELMMLAVNFCESHNIPFYMVPDSFGVAVTSREIDVCRDYPVIELRDASLHSGYKVVKRLTDILLSTVVLLVGLPFWLLIALLIRLTTAGPVFYVQERAGLKGKPFKILKFRTMTADAEQRLKELIDLDSLAEPVFKLDPDPRVTPIGKILRNWGLDEVPQFLNVVWGSMSLVGPRPEAVELVEKYNPWQRRRLKAKPGITGYQQIMSRGIPALEQRTAQDLYYLKHQGLWLDLHILARTIIVVIRGDGVK
jgi:exopolysaccharide biosynthesis polyprenyl glycosylphosphotransferase